MTEDSNCIDDAKTISAKLKKVAITKEELQDNPPLLLLLFRQEMIN